MDRLPPNPDEQLDDHQRACLKAIDVLLDATMRDHTTDLVVPRDVRVALVRLARQVCGAPQRAEQLISTALENDEAASEALLVLRRAWAAEDARFTAVFGTLSYGGSLRLDEQADGNYALTVADQTTDGGATITLKLTATELDSLSTQYATHINKP